MDTKKYPNVFLTQSLVNLSQYDQPNKFEKITSKKLRVISQILDEAPELDNVDRDVNPVGLESDPWDKEVGVNDLVDPRVIEENIPANMEPNNLPSDGQPQSWQEDLKNWFTNN